MAKFSFNQVIPFEATHVGEVIKDELSACNMKQSELSELTGIQKSILNDVIKGKRSLTPEVALLLENALGISATYLMSIQAQYELDCAKPSERVVLQTKMLEIWSVLKDQVSRFIANDAFGGENFSHFKTDSKHMVEYRSSRLCFKADLIEALKENDSFVVHTPNGTFKFTKADFYRVFSNVIETKSYKEGRIYSYNNPPKRAMQFLISGQSIMYKRSEKSILANDLVGEEIRMKIKEIGALWRNSPNNPKINVEVLKNWDNLIEDWIADKNMPLIIRKETSKKGQSFVHPCGREIIVSDNTVAIWVYSNVLKGKVFALSQIKELLSKYELPMMFIATREIKEKAKYTKPLGNNILSGWKLCHIEPIGFNTNASITDLEISDIEDHFRKYVNPNNMFVLPKEIGYLGEIDIFIDEQRR